MHCFLSAEFLSWKSPEWRTTALFLQSRLTAARPAWCPQLAFILVFIDIARPSFGKLLGFVWLMSTIDRKYKLITNCEMFNGAIEDTERGRGWRLMERRLPSVSSQHYDLLITHYFGGFLSQSSCKLAAGTKIQRRAAFNIIGGLSFLTVMAHCATYLKRFNWPFS